MNIRTLFLSTIMFLLVLELLPSVSASHLRSNRGAVPQAPSSRALADSQATLQGQACDSDSQGERYVSQSSGKVSDLAACKKSCEKELMCQSITFFQSGWCSHFSTKCEKTKSDMNAIAMRLKTIQGPFGVLYSKGCDKTQGERYLGQSSSKVSDLAACKKSCEDESKCQSITFYGSGWCSHFSTKCEKTKFDSDAIAMKLKDFKTADTMPGALHSKECDVSQGERYLDQSSGKVSDLAACKKSCEDEANCQSITFYSHGWCSHFSTQCEKTKSIDNAVAKNLKDNRLNNKECDVSQGERYLGQSSGKVSDLAACKKSCDDELMCQSITFYANGWCSHFSTKCEKTKSDSTAIGMQLLKGYLSIDKACDETQGEVYLGQSSSKVSDVAACKKSCEDEAKCQSITFYGSGWCSHFSTKCEKTKFDSNAIAMRLTAFTCDDAVESVSAAHDHTMVVKQDGSLWSTGWNSLGVDVGLHNNFFKVMAGGVKAVVASSNWHKLVVKQDGSLWAAGSNEDGQLGDGSTTYRSSLVQVIDAGVKTVASGSRHTMVVKDDGSLWATGYNKFGQLGDGSTTSRKSFFKVMAGGVKAVFAGLQNTMVLKDDGSLWATGYNVGLGDGSQLRAVTQRNRFVKVIDAGVKAVAMGNGHTAVVKDDGSVWTTGMNGMGQLGDGSETTYRTSFVKVIDAGVKAVAAGWQHTTVVKDDGSVWATGHNQYGPLGDGSTTDRKSFVEVMAGGAKAVAAGQIHTMVVKQDGSLWAAGSNHRGQLGDGTNTNRRSFVKVLSC